MATTYTLQELGSVDVSDSVYTFADLTAGDVTAGGDGAAAGATSGSE